MTPIEKFLRFFLIAAGAVCVMGLGFLAVPLSWMDAIHRLAGLGAMPQGPVVEYLARSACVLYPMLGGVMILSGLKLRQYRTLVLYQGAVWLAFGVLVGAIDYAAGLPGYWTWGESIQTALMGAVILMLGRKIQRV
jgi:hypothetical protein